MLMDVGYFQSICKNQKKNPMASFQQKIKRKYWTQKF